MKKAFVFGLMLMTLIGGSYPVLADRITPKEKIKQAYESMVEKFNIDTSFKFKQDALNGPVCNDNYTNILCHIYTPTQYIVFDPNNLEEATSFPLSLVKDEKKETVFKGLLDPKKNLDIKITQTNEKNECEIHIESGFFDHPTTKLSADFYRFPNYVKPMNKNCEFKRRYKSYDRKLIKKLEEKIKQMLPHDSSFKFKQPGLNYLICYAKPMDYPLCQMYFKDKKIGFALVEAQDILSGKINKVQHSFERPLDKDALHFSEYEILEDTPYKTVFRSKFKDGGFTYSKIEAMDGNICFLHLLSSQNPDISNETLMDKGVSHIPLLPVAPFCEEYEFLEKK